MKIEEIYQTDKPVENVYNFKEMPECLFMTLYDQNFMNSYIRANIDGKNYDCGTIHTGHI